MARRPTWIAIAFLTAVFCGPNRGAAQGGRDRDRPDSSILLDTVVAAEKRFLTLWDSAWRASPGEQLLSLSVSENLASGTRAHNFHCHPDQFGANTALDQRRLIKSPYSFFSVCPSWDLSEVRSTTDERVSLDTALTTIGRILARAARLALIATLDSAARLLPANDFIAGQRVRFLVDDHDYERAQRIATECGAAAWWCRALAGYTYAVRGDVERADSAFAASFALMPEEKRCEWNDYSVLLDSTARGPYGRLSCAKRDSVNERLWWLSDPLFIDRGNERRVEQNARRVLLALRTALPRDERFAWNAIREGGIREEMILRYGWPSLVVWGGPMQDRAHTGYLAAHASPLNEPYTTYEYSRDRVHAVPLWAAINDPFHAVPNDWAVSEPPPSARPPERLEKSPTGRMVALQWMWWPVEHFKPSRPLVQLPDGQHAMLRRQDSLLFAVATDLTEERLNRAKSEPIRGIALVLSEKPGAMHRVADVTGMVGTPLVVTSMIPPAPTVASVEFAAPDMRGPPGGRLRFGITPPAPLSAMRAGAIAVSDPVILRAPADGATLPSDADGALQLMATSTRVGASKQIGVYWETYGLVPTDTVEVAVWIERYTIQGIVRRFGIALRVATDRNTPIAISWKEPQAVNRRNYISGPVPIIGRSVTLDTSKLLKGDYWLDVAIRRAGQEPVRGRTNFVVQ